MPVFNGVLLHIASPSCNLTTHQISLLTMTGKTWTTDVQGDFLRKYVARYHESQANKTLSSVFWPLIFREWFQAFPEKEIEFPGCDELTGPQEIILASKLEVRRQVSNSDECIIMHHCSPKYR